MKGRVNAPEEILYSRSFFTSVRARDSKNGASFPLASRGNRDYYYNVGQTDGCNFFFYFCLGSSLLFPPLPSSSFPLSLDSVLLRRMYVGRTNFSRSVRELFCIYGDRLFPHSRIKAGFCLANIRQETRLRVRACERPSNSVVYNVDARSGSI